MRLEFGQDTGFITCQPLLIYPDLLDLSSKPPISAESMWIPRTIFKALQCWAFTLKQLGDPECSCAHHVTSCNHHVIKYPYVTVVKLDEALGLGIFASSKFLTLVYQTRFQFHASDVSLILSASSNKPSFGTRILSPAEVHGLSEASPYWICTFANNQHNLEDIKQFEHVWACLSSCLHQFEHVPHHFTFAHAAHVSSALWHRSSGR